MSALEIRNERVPGYHAVGTVSGLLLQVKSSGAKSWVLRTHVAGRRCEIGLGSYPSVSLQLAHRVEIDDAYLGGELVGGKRGRGSPNKVEFIAAIQTTESGEPVLICLSKRPFAKESIKRFAQHSLAAPATLVSDGLGCFTAVQGMDILHEQHVTGGGAASAKHPSFLAVNTILGNLKTLLAGTYHSFGFEKYAHRYLAQVQYLFNRRFDLCAILIRLARIACQTRPCPLPAIRAAEAAC